MRGEVDKLKILLALIFVFQGMSIAILAHPLLKLHPWLRLFGLLLMVLGIWYIYYKYKVEKPSVEPETIEAQAKKVLTKTDIVSRIKGEKVKGISSKKEPVQAPEDASILTNMMGKIIKKTEVVSPYILPIIGAIIIDAVIIYNILEGQALDLRGFDTITIMFGISLILYNYIPKGYEFPRDFFVFFLGLLFFILVFPPIFYNALFGSGGNAVITKALLGDPVAGLLNVMGIDSSVTIDESLGKPVATVYFPLAQTGQRASVGIAEACSGIYTMSIFLAAFVTFVLVEYKRFDKKVGLLIGLGIFSAYLANIMRMLIIILVGHYYDINLELQNLNWWHTNAGWIIFMAWIIPFWLLMYRFLMRKDLSKGEATDENVKSV